SVGAHVFLMNETGLRRLGHEKDGYQNGYGYSRHVDGRSDLGAGLHDQPDADEGRGAAEDRICQIVTYGRCAETRAGREQLQKRNTHGSPEQAAANRQQALAYNGREQASLGGHQISWYASKRIYDDTHQ